MLAIGTILMLFIYACTKDDSGPTTTIINNGDDAIIDPSNCWEAGFKGFQIILKKDSGKVNHVFSVSRFVGQCLNNPLFDAYGFGSIYGHRLSFAVIIDQNFSPPGDTLYYDALITDTSAGHKRMTVYSATDTVIYSAQ